LLQHTFALEHNGKDETGVRGRISFHDQAPEKLLGVFFREAVQGPLAARVRILFSRMKKAECSRCDRARLLRSSSSRRNPVTFAIKQSVKYFARHKWSLGCVANPLATDWPIKQRSEICNATQRPFVPGEVFYTLLYREGDGFRREDLSEEAWRDRNENIQPFILENKIRTRAASGPEPLAKEKRRATFPAPDRGS